MLAVGGHDHLSAAVGAGAVGEGDVLDSWGTAEALVRAVAPLDREAVAQAVDDDIMVGWHAVPERQNLLGAMRSGAALGRVMALLGVGPEGRDALERAALEVEPEGIELIGLNDYRVGLVNIGADPSPAIVWRAALESAGKGARDLLDKMARVAGPHTRLVMAGGWSEGVAARAIKEAHCGPFERSAGGLHGRPRRRAHSRARGGTSLSGRSAHTTVSPSPATPQCERQRVHQVEPEPAVQRIRLAPLRLARAARVLDLEVEDAVALRRADADDVGRRPARRAGRCWPPARWPRARRRRARARARGRQASRAGPREPPRRTPRARRPSCAAD